MGGARFCLLRRSGTARPAHRSVGDDLHLYRGLGGPGMRVRSAGCRMVPGWYRGGSSGGSSGNSRIPANRRTAHAEVPRLRRRMRSGGHCRGPAHRRRRFSMRLRVYSRMSFRMRFRRTARLLPRGRRDRSVVRREERWGDAGLRLLQRAFRALRRNLHGRNLSLQIRRGSLSGGQLLRGGRIARGEMVGMQRRRRVQRRP